jgi:hypothetical protein
MRIFILASLLLLSFNAFSTEIISGSTSSSLFLTHNDYSDKYEPTFVFHLGYDHVFTNGIQLGSDAVGSIYNNGSSYSLTVGPGYNFSPDDLLNSFYVLIKGGVVVNDLGGSADTNAVAFVEAGKRFKILDHVSYVPGISVYQDFGPNSADPTIKIIFAKFSFLF